MFSTGLVWFFVQAWIFAIQARTIWLIALLTITTTVAILSQGYLCAIFVSIPPVSVKVRGDSCFYPLSHGEKVDRGRSW